MIIHKNILKILDLAERWIKTDIRFLLKNGGWIFLGQFFSTLFSLVLVYVFANYLPTEIYGTYKYIISIISILYIFSLSGLNQSLTIAIAKGKEGNLFIATKTKFLFSLVGTLIGILLSLYYFFQGNIEYSILVLLSSVFIPFIGSFNIYGSYLQGKKKFKENSILIIFFSFIHSLLLVLTVYFSNNLFIIITVYYLVLAFLNYLFFTFSIKKHPPNTVSDRSFIGYGKHLSLMSVTNTVATHVDKIIIGHLFGPIDVAIYVFANAPIRKLLELFGKILGPLAFVKFSETSVAVLKKTLIIKILKSFLLVIPIFILYVYFSQYLYNIFFPQYYASIKYTRWLALIILAMPFMFLGTAITAQAQKKMLYYYKFSTNLFLIILMLILSPIFGVWGIVWSRVVYHFVSISILMYFFKRMN
ncbi:hypothetical protein C0584_01745 [Candidatus Parcubacteria bacterium]|nr:MAG: hypothetical protein C0584_01745 [Candidatus Parcubacteria bacterium]